MDNGDMLKFDPNVSKQGRKRSIAHKLAANVKRQLVTSNEDRISGLTSNVSEQFYRKVNQIEDDDIVDSLYNDDLRARKSQKSIRKNNTLDKFKDIQEKDYMSKDNINNNNQYLEQSKYFKRSNSINGQYRTCQRKPSSEDEDTSGEATHVSYDSDVDMRLLQHTSGSRRNLYKKHNYSSDFNSSKVVAQMEGLPQRFDDLRVYPPSANDLTSCAEISPNHFNSTPNILKDFISHSRSPWLGGKGGDDDNDDDDEAPSIESSKMTGVSSVLSAVSTEKIRNRGYLAGSTNLGLLSSEELAKLFPDKRMRCFVATWNVGELKNIPTSLNDLLLPAISEVVFDVYAVGIQEAVFDRQEWCVKIQETLGPHFVLYHAASHGTLFLTIFLRRDLIWFLSVPEESIVITRAGPSNIKTKGALAIGFILFGTSFLFINSHFKAHEGRVEDRIEDYKKISSSLSFSKILRARYSLTQDEVPDISLQFDCSFWLGDLNSRMEMKRERIGGTMATGELKPQEIDKLLQFDELQRLRSQGLAFKGFSEGKIRFLPTFKFDVGTSNYDTSNKNRNPSYTDRILFRSRKRGSISCLQYNSVPAFLQSDHKPVYGVYEIELRPGIDSMPLSGGQFNRDVWLAGTKKRMTHQMSKGQKTESSVCLMM